jgi:hypothetical protein
VRTTLTTPAGKISAMYSQILSAASGVCSCACVSMYTCGPDDATHSGLEDDGVAARESGTELPAHHEDGCVLRP